MVLCDIFLLLKPHRDVRHHNTTTSLPYVLTTYYDKIYIAINMSTSTTTSAEKNLNMSGCPSYRFEIRIDSRGGEGGHTGAYDRMLVNSNIYFC